MYCRLIFSQMLSKFYKVGFIILTLIHTLYSQSDTIYFFKNGEIIYNTPVSEIDSILFHQPSNGLSGTFTDSRDGRVYSTITIGTQTWMSENLAYLPQINPPTIRSSTVPYYYVYNYTGTNLHEALSSVYYSKYGVLYNYPAALTACPSGWHLPDTNEFAVLISYLGGHDTGGGKAKTTGYTYWDPANPGATNESGFSGRGSGFYYPATYIFRNERMFGYYWSQNYNIGTTPYIYILEFNTPRFVKTYFVRNYGFSIRCVKNDP